MHLLFCQHFTNILGVVELRNFYLAKMLRWCLVSVIGSYLYIQTLHSDCSHNDDVNPSVLFTFDKYFLNL